MKKIYFLIPILFLFSILLISCYTQLQAPRTTTETNPEYYSDEEYYLSDSLPADQDIIVHHYYHYNDPYYYDPWYYDPWYRGYSSHWGFYIGFSTYWWDPYWYPWGGYGPCCYPVISPYSWYYPYYYYDWYPYYPPGHYYPYENYQKRPWDRRSNEPIRQIARGNSRTDQQLAGGSRRAIAENQAPIYISGSRSESSSPSRIVHRDSGSRTSNTVSAATASKNISSQQRTVKRHDPASGTRTSKATIHQGRSTRSSQYGSYSPKSKSGSSSGSHKSSGNSRSSSGSSVRSSNRGSSSSSGSSSSGSSSGSSSSGSSSSSGRSSSGSSSSGSGSRSVNRK